MLVGTSGNREGAEGGAVVAVEGSTGTEGNCGMAFCLKKNKENLSVQQTTTEERNRHTHTEKDTTRKASLKAIVIVTVTVIVER